MSKAKTVTDTSTERDLTAFQQNVLLVLAEESRYGLAIKRELESFYDEEVNHGRLYPNLDTLIELGLAEKSELDKRTNEYSITEDGIAALLDLFEWRFQKFITDDERAEQIQKLFEAQH
ncbi:PadR family transcriptional regulator [Haladaptatus pallidirubidus]|uniref:PadR family transcriptional regulator n=1 Tax=Haladaptatus pallidirubidus TaxID=1008152 RepID=A0AAV3UHL1_9EURY|nr:PadR family transcriptional regulator [Haladaptatus pallidirubidus]